jgi:hypothetical protein
MFMPPSSMTQATNPGAAVRAGVYGRGRAHSEFVKIDREQATERDHARLGEAVESPLLVQQLEPTSLPNHQLAASALG